jgi:hypothetical protein
MVMTIDGEVRRWQIDVLTQDPDRQLEVRFQAR